MNKTHAFVEPWLQKQKKDGDYLSTFPILFWQELYKLFHTYDSSILKLIPNIRALSYFEKELKINLDHIDWLESIDDLKKHLKDAKKTSPSLLKNVEKFQEENKITFLDDLSKGRVLFSFSKNLKIHVVHHSCGLQELEALEEKITENCKKEKSVFLLKTMKPHGSNSNAHLALDIIYYVAK